MTEDAFLQTLRDKPDDDTTRRVYADWLDEQDDPACRAKAEYIRADLELAALPELPRGTFARLRPAVRRLVAERKRLARRRRELAGKLDLDWMAVASLGRIEACFEFECPLKWEGLAPVEGEAAVRHCEQCRQRVYYCGTLEEARMHAWQGHCVAVDPRVSRRAGDLDNPRVVMMGRFMPPERRLNDD